MPALPALETECAPLPIDPALAHLEDRLLRRIPLVIGVTGHRDLRAQDTAALKAAVKDIFRRLRKEYLAADGHHAGHRSVCLGRGR